MRGWIEAIAIALVFNLVMFGAYFWGGELIGLRQWRSIGQSLGSAQWSLTREKEKGKEMNQKNLGDLSSLLAWHEENAEELEGEPAHEEEYRFHKWATETLRKLLP